MGLGSWGGGSASEKPPQAGGAGSARLPRPPPLPPPAGAGLAARDRCCSEESSWSGDSGRGRMDGAPVVDLGQSEAKLVESKREGQTDIEKTKITMRRGRVSGSRRLVRTPAGTPEAAGLPPASTTRLAK